MAREKKISDFIEEISMGPFGSDITVDNYVSNGVPVLNGSNVSGFKLTEESFNYVSEDKAKSFRKAIARRGDVVITHRGTLGQIAYIPENSKFEKYVISQSQFRVRFNQAIDPRYLVYLFHTDYGRKKLLSFKNHVGVPALAQATTNFRKLKIAIHDFEEQKTIADFISNLQGKIELNNCINAELEAMAKTIYDYWFVQFDFPYDFAQGRPDKNGKPYKSSGGKMVWNEELKREVPEGWEVKIIEDFCKIFTGKKDVNQALGEGKYRFFSCSPNHKYSNEKIYEGKAILISGNGSYTGRTIFVNEGFDLYQRTYACVNISEFEVLEYLYYSILSFLTQKIGGGTHGSAIPYIVYDDIAKEPIAFNDNVVIEFQSIAESILKNVQDLKSQNQQLASLRDWLLPMLMNGQVRVR